MSAEDSKGGAIFGAVSGWFLSAMPEAWLSYGEKLLLGAGLALASGFAYKGGEWAWAAFQRRWRK